MFQGNVFIHLGTRFYMNRGDVKMIGAFSRPTLLPHLKARCNDKQAPIQEAFLLFYTQQVYKERITLTKN